MQPKIWTSGNFSEHPRNSSPFNGLRMTAEPAYDGRGQLFQLRLTIEDFTKSKSGAKLSHTFQPAHSGSELPLRPSGDFTLSGTLSLRRSPVDSDNLVLMLEDGSFGLPRQEHQVLGGLLEVPLHGPPNSGAHPPAHDAKPDGKPLDDAEKKPGEAPPEAGESATGPLSLTPDPAKQGAFHLAGKTRVTLPGGRTFVANLSVHLEPAGPAQQTPEPPVPPRSDAPAPSQPDAPAPSQPDAPAQPTPEPPVPPAHPSPPATSAPTPPAHPPQPSAPATPAPVAPAPPASPPTPPAHPSRAEHGNGPPLTPPSPLDSDPVDRSS